MIILYIVILCWILYNFLAVHDSLRLLVVHSCHYRTWKSYFFCFGLSNCNIIPLFHIMLNFIGQHHTGGISYTSINNNGYFQGIYALCKLTHKFYIFFFQFAGEMSNSHMYKFPQNNLYSYNMIADSLRKIHISENREKITVQRLIYLHVN